jgi:methanethiol S-methyltransferase
MATVQMIFAMLVFAALHSIFARLPIKGWVQARIGVRTYEAFYRITYNFVSVVTFIPVLVVLALSDSTPIWTLTGVPAIIFRTLQVIGLLGLTVSIMQIEAMRFVGLSQVRAYLNDDPLPLPPEPLQTEGVYQLVRHPLYFFSLLVLWFTPSMTDISLVFVVSATLYFVLGSLLEERTMEKVIGEPYRTYQQQVPWMFPFVK